MKKIEIKKASTFLVLFTVLVINSTSVSAQHFFPRFAPFMVWLLWLESASVTHLSILSGYMLFIQRWVCA